MKIISVWLTLAIISCSGCSGGTTRTSAGGSQSTAYTSTSSSTETSSSTVTSTDQSAEIEDIENELTADNKYYWLSDCQSIDGKYVILQETFERGSDGKIAYTAAGVFVTNCSNSASLLNTLYSKGTFEVEKSSSVVQGAYEISRTISNNYVKISSQNSLEQFNQTKKCQKTNWKLDETVEVTNCSDDDNLTVMKVGINYDILKFKSSTSYAEGKYTDSLDGLTAEARPTSLDENLVFKKTLIE